MPIESWPRQIIAEFVLIAWKKKVLLEQIHISGFSFPATTINAVKKTALFAERPYVHMFDISYNQQYYVASSAQTFTTEFI